MTIDQFARIARDCRDAQRKYFAARREGKQGGQELLESKAAEAKLDKAIRDTLDPQSPMLPGM